MTAIDAQRNQAEARELFDYFRADAEKRGLDLLAVTASVRETTFGPFYTNRLYNSGFVREADRRWYTAGPGPKRTLITASSADAPPPAGVDSAATAR